MFFLISTIKGRVEANWTIPAFVPLIALSHGFIALHPSYKKWVYWTAPVTILIVLAARLYMGLDLPKSTALSKDEFHGNKEWVKAIESRTNEEAVVVLDSYQTPSKYWFYSGQPALGLNTPLYRRNNYNYWPLERQMIGKPALVIGAYDSVYLNDRFTNEHLKESGSMHVPFYYSLSAIRFNKIDAIGSKEDVHIYFDAEVPADYLAIIQTKPVDTAAIYIAMIKEGQPVRYINTGIGVSALKSSSMKMDVHVKMPVPEKDQLLKLAISTVIPGRPSVNSTAFKIK